MESYQWNKILKAEEEALRVLINNSHGPFLHGLPRTAGWGYPEPYTRDLMIASLGILVSGHPKLVSTLRRTLETLAQNQSSRGHIPSLVHDKEDRGASDTTPLFLLAVAFYRRVTGCNDFLQEAVHKALTWMEYQSPADRSLVAHLPTSDWRDEQWVLGYGLYVNTLVYSYLRFYGFDRKADMVRNLMSRFTITGGVQNKHIHEGLVVKHKPYYALWSYKIYSSERFDLLGNSIAILTGLASSSRAQSMITWIEEECKAMRKNGNLGVELPPNLFPFIKPGDPDWLPRYNEYNKPGEYHNGGIWPFICGFYIAALVAARRYRLAEKRLVALTDLVVLSRDARNEFGFNEWIGSQDGEPRGEDWQTWSAAMYRYAVDCVKNKTTRFFDEIRLI
ncbi:MAG: glycoside hydrolase 100 family protein [Chitinispirillia bacterium]